MLARRSSHSVIVALLALAACKDKARPPGEGSEKTDRALEAELGVTALPASTRVVIGISVTKVVASPLARRLFHEALARDPSAGPRLDAILERCKLDVERDLTGVTIAMGAPEDVALLARGKLDGKAIADCVRVEVAGAGGTLREESFAGRVLYGAESGDHKQQVWLTVAGGEGVLIATSQTWLQAIVAPTTDKIGARADTMALLGRVDQKAAVWGVGYVPSEAGARLVELAGGAVGQPAKAVSFAVDAAEGLDLRLAVDMAAPEDAAGLATFAKKQLDILAMAAQKLGLGRVVARTEITSEGATVHVALRLDPADLKQVEAAFAGPTSEAKSEQKEQAR